MKILIDNGHGKNTPGKRSPDGKFREYLYAREIAEAIEGELKFLGLDAERIVTETEDISLEERARRVNEICGRLGAENVVLVSIHCNASKNGEWGKARGWSAYTSKGKTKSDELATMLYVEAAKNFAGQTLRKEFSDGDPDWEEGFYGIYRFFYLHNRRRSPFHVFVFSCADHSQNCRAVSRPLFHAKRRYGYPQHVSNNFLPNFALCATAANFRLFDC